MCLYVLDNVDMHVIDQFKVASGRTRAPRSQPDTMPPFMTHGGNTSEYIMPSIINPWIQMLGGGEKHFKEGIQSMAKDS